MFDEDLKAMIYGPFSVPAEFAGKEIRVIFTDEGEIREYGNTLIEYESPVAVCYPEDVATAANGDEIVINGKSYYIASIKENANGETELTLTEDDLNG